MKKIKTVLKIVGIIIAIVIIGVLILKISVTKKYDGKEVKLISKEDITLYLTDIKYDEEQGPQLYFRFDKNENDTTNYSIEVTTRYINGVRLYSYEKIGLQDTTSINLYSFYKRDLDALNLKTNKEKLNKYGYTVQDYKNGFSNINSFDLEIKLYKWVYDDEKKQSNEMIDVQDRATIDIVRGHEVKIGSLYKIIKVNGNENNLLKNIYKVKIEQRTKISKSIPEENWKEFDEIIPNDIIANIDEITGSDNSKLKKDEVLRQLRKKKYAEYTEEIEISETYERKDRGYQMFDKDGNQMITIIPYYINSITALPEEYYKITYNDKTVYYNVKD